MRVSQITIFTFDEKEKQTNLSNRFYCDSSSSLDEHNQTHTPNTLSKSQPIEEIPIPLPTSIKSSESINSTNSEKPSSASKTKVHRCRQCSYVSSVKVCYIYILEK